MDQISMFSAEASGPAVDDLAGVLCGPGQLVSFAGTAARLSVVVEQRWRARVLVAEYRRRGVEAELAASDGDEHLVRTAFRADLIALAAAWGGAVKAVPETFRLTGGALRLWALAAGRRTDSGYLLAFDRDAPATHERLAHALDGLGLAGKVLGTRGDEPGVRVTGRRRLERLAELLGSAPPGADVLWPDCPPPGEVTPRDGRPRQPADLAGKGQLDLLTA